MNTENIKQYVHAFNQIAKRFDVIINLSKEYGEYFESRGMIEVEYGKRLKTLINNINTKTFSKELTKEHLESSTKVFFSSFDENNSIVADVHLKIGKAFQVDIARSLYALAKDVDAQKKKIVGEVIRKKKIHEELLNFATRLESYYFTILRDVKESAKYINETKDQRYVPKHMKFLKSLEEAEQNYRNAIEKENHCYDLLYQTEIVNSLDSCFKLFDLHSSELAKIMNHAHSLFKELGDSAGSFVDKTAQLQGVLDNNTDLKEFLDSINSPTSSKMSLKVEVPPEIHVDAPSPKKSWGFSSLATGIASGLSNSFSSLTSMTNSHNNTPQPNAPQPSTSDNQSATLVDEQPSNLPQETQEEEEVKETSIKEEVTIIENVIEPIEINEDHDGSKTQNADAKVEEKIIEIKNEVVAATSGVIPQQTLVDDEEDIYDKSPSPVSIVQNIQRTKSPEGNDDDESDELIVVPVQESSNTSEEEEEEEEEEDDDEPTNSFI
ncbi:F-BAR domain-containing protein [Entamoeba marina]